MSCVPLAISSARGCSVVFNGLDIGPMWDFCVNSLCKELGSPYVAACAPPPPCTRCVAVTRNG